MIFEYKTEYRFGRRRRVSRTYGGVRALIAIAFDLALGFTFGLIGFGLWLIRHCLVTVYRVAVALVSLPLKAGRAVSDAYPVRKATKPAWASLDEL